MKARDNPLSTDRVLAIRYRPQGWTWPQLLSRLEAMEGAARIGPAQLRAPASRHRNAAKRNEQLVAAALTYPYAADSLLDRSGNRGPSRDAQENRAQLCR